jgi:hypothetical protein
MKRIISSTILGMLLISCGTTRHESIPSTATLGRQVLVIHETPDGRVTHFRRQAESHELVLQGQAFSGGVDGRIVFAATRERDCHAEYLECLNECESSGLPPGFEHIERGGAAHSRYCRDRCRQPYLDCEELQELRARKPHRFMSVDDALDWLKRNRRAVLVGSVVVIAGVTFVVVSAGAGAVVLAPALLLASSGVSSRLPFVEVSP